MERLYYSIFIFIIIFLVCFNTVLGQALNEKGAIKEVIEKYLAYVTFGNLDSAMSCISKNYLAIDKNGQPIDYQRLRSFLKYRIDQLYKTYIDYSISDIDVVISSVQDNLAEAEVKYNWKGLNLNTFKEEIGTRDLSVSLKKEDNAWKITKIIPKATPNP